MHRIALLGASVLSSFALHGCRSAPVIPLPPRVEVCQLDPLVITPEEITYQAAILIDNRMRCPLTIDRVDWHVDLHDQPLIDESFDALHPMRSRARQRVRFPFRVSMEDIGDSMVDVLAEEGIRVDFRGAVHPSGFASVPFAATRTIPLPKIPRVSIEGANGNPLRGAFTVFVGVENTNRFPIRVEAIDSHLAINGKTYPLLQSEECAAIRPGDVGRVALTMRHTRGKALSMAWNIFRSPGPSRFELGGSIACATPHGLIRVPIALASE